MSSSDRKPLSIVSSAPSAMGVLVLDSKGRVLVVRLSGEDYEDWEQNYLSSPELEDVTTSQ